MGFNEVFLCRVSEDGALLMAPEEQARRDACLRRLAGKPVDVVIRAHRSTRSGQANRYYWGVVVALIAEHCGYDPDDMHEALAMKFLRIEDCPVTGAPRRTRTPKTNTKEFAEYVDGCVRFAAQELGVIIPAPNEIEVSQ